MASNLTKSQLLSELEAARVEIQRLSAVNESLRNDAAMLREIAAKRNAEAAHDAGWHRRTVPDRAQHVSAYREMLAKARDEAMRTGRVVRVG